MLAKKKPKEEYKYECPKYEAKFRIFMTQDLDLRKKIQDKIRDNGNYCPTKNVRCMCEEFNLMDKANIPCACGLYYKVERSEEEMRKYVTSYKNKNNILSAKEKQILNEKIPSEDDEMKLAPPQEDD